MKNKVKIIYQYLSVKNRSVYISYGLAVLSSFFILFIHNHFVNLLWNASPFLIFLPAVIITSWYGGFLPGLVATIIATLVGDYFFFNPLYTFRVATISDTIRLLLFSTVGLLISMINQSFYNQKEEKEQLLIELALSEDRFKHIANTTPVMLWIIDELGRPLFINKTFQDFMGQNEKDKPWTTYIHPEDKNEALKAMRSAIGEKKKFQYECRLKRRGENYHWVVITGIPNYSSSKSFVGYFGTCIDIHGQKQLETQKTTFISMVAHELRTPLATSQLINQLLIKKFKQKHSEEDVADLENMYEELDNLSDLIHELLQFVRGEQGDLPLSISTIQINHLIQTIIAHYRESHNNISFILNSEEKYRIRADKKRLKQVFYNLLDNAVKANASKISITLDKKGSCLMIAIKDNGVGISQVTQKHIFKRYFQAANDKHGGFGLGLYIAKQIIQKHHGKIWVESKEQKGSTFFISIPYI